MCRVPRISHFSTKYLEEFGLPSSGNKSVDIEMARQLHHVYITINDMIELYHQSQTVCIVNQADVRSVYEICQDYTFDWAERIRGSIYQSTAPFGDLIKIDEFAEAVYQYAGHEYGNDFARTFVPQGVMKEVADLNKMFDSIDDRIKQKKKSKENAYEVKNMYSPDNKGFVEPQKEQEETKLPDRPSVRDLFESYMDPGSRR